MKTLIGSSSKNFTICTIIVLIFFGFLLYFKKWPRYLLHLATHQIYIHKNKILLENLNISQIPTARQITQKEKNNLTLITSIKEYGKIHLYLKDSKRYTKIVFLPRKNLGWFITITPEFSFSPYKFYIPFISSFTYIGFFDFNLLNKWKNEYQEKGYDIYTSIIGAYNTLAFFDDPIFSTYLLYSSKNLIQTILHEMVHEKIWISNETSLNEKIATFLANKMTISFLKQNNMKYNIVRTTAEKEKTQQEKTDFWLLFKKTKEKLYSLYLDKKENNIEHKRKEKKNILTEFKNKLIQMKNNNQYFINLPKHILESNEINNSMFIQFNRYSTKINNQELEKIFTTQCKKKISCFIEKIKKISTDKQSLKFFKKSFRVY